LRFLVTGSSGFIGAAMAHRLAKRGEDVHVFLRDASRAWRLEGMLPKLSAYAVDLKDRDAVFRAVSDIKPDVIFHFAAYGAYWHQKDAKATIETNLLGTVNLLEACRSAGFRCFVNAGSSSEYGIKEKPMAETDLPEPNSIYGVTKSAATLYCRHMARDFGLPVVMLRIFAAYGYFEEPGRLIPSLVVPSLKNESPRLSTPTSVRDFIFVEDVLDAFERAAETDAARGEILNIGTGVQHSVGEAADLVRKLTGCRKEVVWGAEEKKQPEPKVWAADMSKTQRILRWKPGHDFESGLEKTVDWFRANLANYPCYV